MNLYELSRFYRHISRIESTTIFLFLQRKLNVHVHGAFQRKHQCKVASARKHAKPVPQYRANCELRNDVTEKPCFQTRWLLKKSH